LLLPFAGLMPFYYTAAARFVNLPHPAAFFLAIRRIFCVSCRITMAKIILLLRRTLTMMDDKQLTEEYLDGKVVFPGKIIRVEHWHVRLPNGDRLAVAATPLPPRVRQKGHHISVFLFRQRPFHSGQPYLDRHISPPYSPVFPFFFILQPDFPHVKAHR